MLMVKRVVNLTLDHRLVERFDKIVKVGNRSAVIETLMMKYLENSKGNGGKI